MSRTRSIPLWFVVFLLALAALSLPGTAVANTIIVDSPIQPTFAIPGIFSLKFGDDISTSQIEIPALNAVASVDGLTLGPNLGWNSITLNQQQPAVSSAATIAGAQVTVGGPQTGYSANATAQVDLHPGPGFQAAGTVGVVYDGMGRTAGLVLQDASVNVPTWPLGLELMGINTGQGTLTIDSAEVGLPIIASAMTVDGFRTGSGGTGWDSLTLAQNPDVPLKIGEAATITELELDLPAAGTDEATALSAQVAVHPGPGLQAEGKIGVVRGGAGGSSGLMIQDGSVTVPTWPVGLDIQGINTGEGTLTLDSAKVGIPVLASAVEVDNLSVGSGGTSFDSLTLAQNPEAPLKIGNAAAISDIQLAVPGTGVDQPTTLSAQVEVHPGPGFQAQGTVGVVRGGASGGSGVMIQDASVSVPTWPVGLELTGINTGEGAITVDSAQVGIPVAGSAVTVNGLSVGSSGTSWESMSLAQSPEAPIKIGNVGTISGIELTVPAPGVQEPATLAADFAFNVGDVAYLEGELIGVRDRTGGPSGVALKDTTASVQIPGWGLQLTGINSVQGGVKVDKVTFASEPINLTAELTGVTVGAGGGMTFDEAKVTGGDGFQMTMTKTDAGYVLTTTSVLPIATK